MAVGILQPDGVFDAPCEEKFRVRLPADRAKYVRDCDPETPAARLYVATLNGDDILLWPKISFVTWRERLPRQTSDERKQTRRILAALQFYGADAEIDQQGRFILPRNVRDALRLDKAPAGFIGYNDEGIFRLVIPDRFEKVKQE